MGDTEIQSPVETVERPAPFQAPAELVVQPLTRSTNAPPQRRISFADQFGGEAQCE
jgi:hypothetical protein